MLKKSWFLLFFLPFLTGCMNTYNYQLIAPVKNNTYPVLNVKLLYKYIDDNITGKGCDYTKETINLFDRKMIFRFPRDRRILSFRAIIEPFYDPRMNKNGKKVSEYRIFTYGCHKLGGIRWLNCNEKELSKVFSKVGSNDTVWIIAKGTFGIPENIYDLDDPYALLRTTEVTGFFIDKKYNFPK